MWEMLFVKLANAIIISLIALGVTWYFSDINLGKILSMAIIAGFITELPIILLASFITKPDAIFIVLQVIFTVVALYFFVHASKPEINGVLSKWALWISLIGIVMHLYRIYPESRTTVTMSLILVLIIGGIKYGLTMYHKSIGIKELHKAQKQNFNN